MNDPSKLQILPINKKLEEQNLDNLFTEEQRKRIQAYAKKAVPIWCWKDSKTCPFKPDKDVIFPLHIHIKELKYVKMEIPDISELVSIVFILSVEA